MNDDRERRPQNSRGDVRDREPIHRQQNRDRELDRGDARWGDRRDSIRNDTRERRFTENPGNEKRRSSPDRDRRGDSRSKKEARKSREDIAVVPVIIETHSVLKDKPHVVGKLVTCLQFV